MHILSVWRRPVLGTTGYWEKSWSCLCSARRWAGLPLWLPAGTTLRETLVNFLREEQLRRGYELISTPHIGHLDLYRTVDTTPITAKVNFHL